MKKIGIKQVVIAVVILAVAYGVVAKTQSMWPFDPTSGWNKYDNKQLGFSLRLPPSWNGYFVTSKGETIEFKIPTKEKAWGGSATPFVILRCTDAAYAAAQSLDYPALCQGPLLGSKGGYSYTWGLSQEAPPADVQAAYNDIRAAIATFKLK